MTDFPFAETIIETRKCRITGDEFVVTDKDMEMYQKLGIPVPTLCPREIWRNLLGYRNEWNLFNSRCSKTGAMMLSQYRPDTIFPVYNHKLWWSEDWSAYEYGRDFDFSRSFFDQYKSLQDVVPRVGTTIFNSENCDYNSHAKNSKNCYLCSLFNNCENIYYSYWTTESRRVIESVMTKNSENIYGCVDIFGCYSCFKCQNCRDCRDCYFSAQLQNCQNCIACTNLNGKQYYIYNKPSTKEEFEQALKLVQSNQTFWDNAQNAIQKLFQGACRPFSLFLNTENCTGNYLRNCRDCYDCFDGTGNCDNNRHIISFAGIVKDCIWSYSATSLDSGSNQQSIYSSVTTNVYNVVSSFYIFDSKDIMYSDSCRNSSDLFGCIGVNHGKFSLLNKSYSQQEYSTLKSKVIDHMKSTGEWGEFFPLKYSPYPYDDTAAQDWYPLTQDEVQKREGRWGGDYVSGQTHGSTPTAPTEILHISQYDEKIVGLETAKHNIDHVLKTVFRCPITGKPFQIIRQELLFHIENGIPLPTTHPRQRTRELMKLRNPRVLHEKECSDCGKMMSTSYVPGGNEKILCEDCFRKIMY